MLLLGIFLALFGAASLALAMVTQRYALAYSEDNVPFCGSTLPRNIVWFIGLVIYGIANGFYAFSLLFGPLSLLAGIFTTLLIFNLLFAWYLLGEKLTPPRVVGAVVIFSGVVMCIIATPGNTETEFTPKKIEQLSSRVVGAFYVCFLGLIVLLSVFSISWYERKYPISSLNVSARSIPHQRTTDTSKNEVAFERIIRSVPTIHIDTDVDIGIDIDIDDAIILPDPSPQYSPPIWLDKIMCLVYPGSLGVDEGIAHLTMKASMSMLETCRQAAASERQEDQCISPVLYIYIVMWVTASLATLWWLRRVFHRYETTLALPIEYGAVNAVSVCSGLIFYKEAQFMSAWQLVVMLIGVFVILTGIAVGRLSYVPFEQHAPSSPPPLQS